MEEARPAVRISFLNFAQQKGPIDQNDINNFFQKKFVWSKWTILSPKMAHPHNSGSNVRFFLKNCTMKRPNSR